MNTIRLEIDGSDCASDMELSAKCADEVKKVQAQHPDKEIEIIEKARCRDTIGLGRSAYVVLKVKELTFCKTCRHARMTEILQCTKRRDRVTGEFVPCADEREGIVKGLPINMQTCAPEGRNWEPNISEGL
jgi:hypothetical protein